MRYVDAIRCCRKIAADDPAFPRGLMRLQPDQRPGFLYVAGDIPPPPAVAIVGTRSPDAHGIALARKLASECALRNIAVISGGAAGIDSAAHLGCLEAGGRTIVVLAGSLDIPTPASSAWIFARAVLEGGCVMSEHPPGYPPYRSLFLSRNRLIAALAGCVVVVQARLRSGALSTASWATLCSVKLFAVGGSPLNTLHAGTNGLIHERKASIIVTLPSFIREMTSLLQVRDRTGAGRGGGPPAADHAAREGEAKVLQLLGSEPLSMDDIAGATGLDAGEISQVLFDLEMKGLACTADPGRYIATADALLIKNTEVENDEEN
jgi:DNA processing protein